MASKKVRVEQFLEVSGADELGYDVPSHLMYSLRSAVRKVRFSGSTKQCLERYRLDHQDKPELYQASLASLADFTDCRQKTVAGWFRGVQLPKFINWLRVQFWLWEQGYLSTEIMQLSNSARRLIEMMLRGHLSFKQATERLRFKSQSDLAAVLNGDFDGLSSYDKSLLVGRIHRVMTELNDELLQRDRERIITDEEEAVLDDPEYFDACRRFGLLPRRRRDKKQRKKNKKR